MLLFIRERFSLYFFESNLFVVIIYRARVEMLFATFIFFSPSASEFISNLIRSQSAACGGSTLHTHKRRLCARLYYQGDLSLFFFGFETQTIDDE
jgi:hypothetical protein